MRHSTKPLQTSRSSQNYRDYLKSDSDPELSRKIPKKRIQISSGPPESRIAAQNSFSVYQKSRLSCKQFHRKDPNKIAWKSELESVPDTYSDETEVDEGQDSCDNTKPDPGLLEFSLNGAELSLKSGNSENLRNH